MAAVRTAGHPARTGAVPAGRTAAVRGALLGTAVFTGVGGRVWRVAHGIPLHVRLRVRLPGQQLPLPPAWFKSTVPRHPAVETDFPRISGKERPGSPVRDGTRGRKEGRGVLGSTAAFGQAFVRACTWFGYRNCAYEKCFCDSGSHISTPAATATAEPMKPRFSVTSWSSSEITASPARMLRTKRAQRAPSLSLIAMKM